MQIRFSGEQAERHSHGHLVVVHACDEEDEGWDEGKEEDLQGIHKASACVTHDHLPYFPFSITLQSYAARHAALSSSLAGSFCQSLCRLLETSCKPTQANTLLGHKIPVTMIQRNMRMTHRVFGNAQENLPRQRVRVPLLLGPDNSCSPLHQSMVLFSNAL